MTRVNRNPITKAPDVDDECAPRDLPVSGNDLLDRMTSQNSNSTGDCDRNPSPHGLPPTFGQVGVISRVGDCGEANSIAHEKNIGSGGARRDAGGVRPQLAGEDRSA